MSSVLLVEVHEEVPNLHEVDPHVVIQGLRQLYVVIMQNAEHGPPVTGEVKQGHMSMRRAIAAYAGLCYQCMMPNSRQPRSSHTP